MFCLKISKLSGTEEFDDLRFEGADFFQRMVKGADGILQFRPVLVHLHGLLGGIPAFREQMHGPLTGFGSQHHAFHQFAQAVAGLCSWRGLVCFRRLHCGYRAALEIGVQDAEHGEIFVLQRLGPAHIFQRGPIPVGLREKQQTPFDVRQLLGVVEDPARQPDGFVVAGVGADVHRVLQVEQDDQVVGRHQVLEEFVDLRPAAFDFLFLSLPERQPIEFARIVQHFQFRQHLRPDTNGPL